MKSIIAKTLFILPITLLLSACGAEEKTSEETEETQIALVNIEKVELQSFVHEIRVQGNVETDQDILLSSEMGGLITNVNMKEGQKVSKGQVIASVDASVLSSNMLELNTQLEYAEYMLEKQLELNKRGVGSKFDLEAAQSQVNALKASQNSLSTQQGKATIRAPFSGVVDQVFARQGQMAGPASPIVRLVNNKTVDIVATISEKHLANIEVGTPIQVSFPNYKDTLIDLKVTNVGNYIEPTNRTFRIMSTIKNNKLFLPNMLAEIRITDLAVDNGLVISSKSILKDQDNKDFVYVAKKTEDGLYKVSKVNIVVIAKFEGKALIEQSKNIKPGLMIVVEGAKGITVGDIVRNK
jgi:RND family efflux transporter MFP subunit